MRASNSSRNAAATATNANRLPAGWPVFEGSAEVLGAAHRRALGRNPDDVDLHVGAFVTGNDVDEVLKDASLHR